MDKYYPQVRSSKEPKCHLLNASSKLLEEGVDVALFGMPFHDGRADPEGSRHGPGQIRRMSHTIKDLNLATRVAPFELCRVADIGDAPVTPFNPPKSLDQLTGFCKEVCEAGAIPLAVGGDHTIAIPMMRGLAGVHGPLSVLHVDAHPDTWDVLGDENGGRYNSGTPFRRAVEEGLEDPSKHIMIGIRGTMLNRPDVLAAYDWAEEQGMTVLWMDQCDQLGPKGIVETIHRVIGDSPFYISIDIDGIDPLDMPGTASPEPGGIKFRDMQLILRGLQGLNLVGADINEVCPSLDPSGMTAFHAAHLLFEILCLAAEQKKSIDEID